MSSKRSSWLRRLNPDDGLVVVPNWDEEDAKRQADAEAARFGPQIDTAFEEDARRCQKEGHAHPLVKMCLRCGDVLGEVE